MLAGRSRELAVVHGCLEAARGGSAATLAIVGEPGLGKTSLLQAACDEAAATGMSVVRLDCLQSEAALPAAGLSILLPRLGASAASDSTAALFDALTTGHDGTPRLLAVDDIQWLDEPSLRALAFACRRLLADPVAVLVTGRPEVLSLPEVTGLPVELLGPLSESDGMALLRASFPTMPDARARDIVQALGGVPLALRDVERLLPGEVLLGTAPLPTPLPVSEAVQARYASGFASLAPPARRAVVLLAAEDRGDAGLLVEALADDGLTLGDLDEAEAMGILRCDPTPSFAHPLARAAVHSAASPQERRHAHSVLATALDRRGLADRALRHRVEAATGPDPALSRDLADAARRSAERPGGHPESATLFRLAARFAVDPETRDRLLLDTAEYADPEEMARLTSELMASGVPEIRTRATLLRAERDVSLAPAERIDLLHGLVDEELTPALVRDRDLIWAWVLMESGDTHALLRLADRVQRHLAHDDWRAKATLGIAFTYLGRAAESVALLTDALEGTMGVDPHTLSPPAVFDWAIIPGWLGDDAEHGRRFRLMDRVLRATGQPEHAASAAFLMSERLRREGAWSACAALLGESIDLAQAIGIPSPTEHVRLAALHAEAGRAEETELALAQARERFSAHPLPWHEHWIAYARGTLALAIGHSADAVTYLRPLADSPVLGRGARDAVATGLANLVEAQAAVQEMDAASRTAANLAERLDGFVDPYGMALVARARALAGVGDVEEHLREALDHLSRTTDAFDTARVHLLLGEHQRRDRRPKQAREWLGAALEEFVRLDARPWAERAARELAASGQRPQATTSAPVALTPQEMRVAMAVLEGATNVEVAAALYLSVKTVEFHLGRVYRKLNVRSRGGLATALGRAGLLP